MTNCWHCKKELQELPAKMPFRALCDHCSAWLHSCKNCVYYQPGLPNDCKVPGTEYVPDREGANFCEEFKQATIEAKEDNSLSDAAKKLFGEDDIPKKKDFNSLFEEE